MQSEPKTFRKRPVVIEAVQWTGKNVLAVYSFMHGAPTIKHDIARDKWYDFEGSHLDKDWHIKTLEDGPNAEAKHVASVGDWIIKGVEGEFYPCKPSVFAATYEDAVSVSPSPISADAVVEACAAVAYRVCAETRHVMLGTQASAEILALKGTFPATPEAKSEVAIKPLVWDEARISDRWPRFTAETILGTYEALQWSSGDFGYTCPNTDRDYPKEEHGDLESLEAAKAAAQTDYETRIRSALVDPEGGV